MLIVAALGGNALLRRGERPDSDVQQRHLRAAVNALAALARGHQLVVTYGNGPQVGVLALESTTDPALSHPYPLDVLGAQTQGMIGYWLLQALDNALPGRTVASLITQTVVFPDDPAFATPSKFVGPMYSKEQAHELAQSRGWTCKQDGVGWRRVVPSPAPHRIVEEPLIRQLLDAGAVVVCAGGGGAPVISNERGQIEGVEAVIDKDATTSLLAATLGADMLLLLTDVATVQAGFGTSTPEPITRATPTDLRDRSFPPGSMGPKVAAACRFVELTGGVAAIGALEDAEAIVAGKSGTVVTTTGRYPSEG